MEEHQRRKVLNESPCDGQGATPLAPEHPGRDERLAQELLLMLNRKRYDDRGVGWKLGVLFPLESLVALVMGSGPDALLAL